jgi:hypothetical protein
VRLLVLAIDSAEPISRADIVLAIPKLPRNARIAMEELPMPGPDEDGWVIVEAVSRAAQLLEGGNG